MGLFSFPAQCLGLVGSSPALLYRLVHGVRGCGTVCVLSCLPTTEYWSLVFRLVFGVVTSTIAAKSILIVGSGL